MILPDEAAGVEGSDEPAVMSHDDIIGEAVQEEEALVARQAVVQLVPPSGPSSFDDTDNTEPNTLACSGDHKPGCKTDGESF